MRLFRRRNTDPELNAELRFHLDHLIAEKIRSGMTPEDARRAALLEFGGLDPAREAMRDLRPFERTRLFLLDLRYALRRLRRAPGFTAMAIASLALGIGANTFVFSLVNATLLRLIPIERPGEMVWFATSSFPRALNYPFFQHLEGDARFSGLLCAFPTSVHVTTPSGAERAEAELVSGSYFSTLGVRAHLGRLLTPEDDRVPLGHPVAVVSHAYWQTRLGADPHAAGRTIRINGAAYTVVGVTQPGFAGIEHGFRRSIFVPMKMKPQITPGWDGLDRPLIAWLGIAGRLKPGVDRDALGREINARLHAFQKPHLEADKRLSASQRELIGGRRVWLETLGDAALDARVRRHLRTLSGVVAALLLLACSNLAGLLLARGLERRREIATCLSLGAPRFRVIRQLLCESLLLGAAGGLVGLFLGGWLAPAVAARFPLAGPGSSFDVSVDTTVLAFTLVVCFLATVTFGLAPAWQATRLDLITSLKGASQGPRGRRLRQSLLAGQVGLALVLLTLAGLFSTNLRRLLAFDVGFARSQLLIGEISPTLNGYDNPQRLALYRRLDERLAAEAKAPGSGIVAAALSNVAPMSLYYWTSLFLVDGKPEEKDFIPRAVAVGPGYFSTLRIPLRRGRLIEERDDESAPRVALISESLARRTFPDSDPIGRRFVADYRDREGSRFEIVGVVADVDLNDPRRRDYRECVYVPYRQWPFPAQAIVIQARLRSAGAEQEAATSLRRIVRALDPNLALYDIRTIERAMDSLLNNERLVTLFTGFFAVLAGLLAALGIHGILSREVATRTPEIGIRLALGASRHSLLWSLVRDTLLFAALGALAGILCVIAIQPWLASMLVDVRPADPVVLMLALLGLLAVSLSGALWPGRKATRVDPAAALRCE